MAILLSAFREDSSKKLDGVTVDATGTGKDYDLSARREAPGLLILSRRKEQRISNPGPPALQLSDTITFRSQGILSCA